MRERIEYVDLAKGICILLVVLDHVANEGYFLGGDYPLNEVFEQMRMPLYFILSGLFFKDYAGGIREFVLRKVNRILIPYVFFFCLLRLVGWVVRTQTAFPQTGVNIDAIWGPLWFLRCLFMMNIIFALAYYAVRRIPAGPLAKDILLAAFVFVLGIVGYHAGNLHLNFGTALTALPLLWAGFVLNRRLHLLSRRLPWWWSLLAAFMLFAMLHYLYVGENMFFSNTYSSPLPQLYLAGFSGSLAILMLSSVLRRLPILSYIGRYSIIVLCTHQVGITLLAALRTLLPEPWQQTGWAESFVFLAIVIAFSALCCHLLRRYIPWFTAQEDLIKVDFAPTQHA